MPICHRARWMTMGRTLSRCRILGKLTAGAVSGSIAAGATGVDGRSSHIPTKPQWPWRHVIHVADTVPLSENRLRYYDHPVIKVLAIWRELSWYEVFRRGKDTLDASKAPLNDLGQSAGARCLRRRRRPPSADFHRRRFQTL